MWRLATVAFLACLACAGCQRPAWMQDTDVLFESRETFFSKANNGDQLLPGANERPPSPKE
jgi:hypothetical protein